MGRSRRLRRERSGQVEACQSAPKAQGVRESRFCKCLSRLEFFWVTVSICRKNTITPSRNFVGRGRARLLASRAHRCAACSPVAQQSWRPFGRWQRNGQAIPTGRSGHWRGKPRRLAGLRLGSRRSAGEVHRHVEGLLCEGEYLRKGLIVERTRRIVSTVDIG